MADANEEKKKRDLIIGLQMNVVRDIYSSTQKTVSAGYNFLLTYMVHPRLEGGLYFGQSHRNDPIFHARPEDSLVRKDWSIYVVARASQWIDVDSPISTVRINSEKALDYEFDYCCYLGIQTLVISLRNRNCINLARRLLKKAPPADHYDVLCIWIEVPMTNPEEERKLFLNDSSCNLSKNDAAESTWEWWNTVRTITNGQKVYLALKMNSHLTELDALRWYSEPIHALMIDTSLFKSDKSGFPILSPILQVFVQNVLNLNNKARIVITGNLDGDIKMYRQHLDHLFKTSKSHDDVNRYGEDGVWKLQLPVRPIRDVVDINTYAILETDEVKYSAYGKAIKQALADTLYDKETEERTLSILLIGVGRGTLVDVLLEATAEIERIKITLYEKNQNIIPSLYFQQKLRWANKVTIVEHDPENWDVSEKFDIMILELMGTVVDRELFPETLDRAKKFLKEGGLMIPSSCVTYAAPTSAPRYHGAVAEHNTCDTDSLKCYESPYAVVSPDHTVMANPLPLFTFSYPSNEEPVDYNRYSIIKFKANYNYLLHGFLSFFEAVLYKDIKLSVHPHDYRKGFYSWIPLYFPFRVPVYIKKNEDVTLHFWRCVADTADSIWYEWGLSQPQTTLIHNPNGRLHKMLTSTTMF